MYLFASRVRSSIALLVIAAAAACTQDLPTDASELSPRAAKGGPGGATGGTQPGGTSVTRALPNAAKRSTTLDVRVFGSGFDRSMTARWAIAGVVTSKVIVNSTRYVSSTELVANVTVTADADFTKYDIVLTSAKGGKGGIGTELFEVVEQLDLGTLGGAYTSATAINDAGQIAGYSSYAANGNFSGNDRPVIWSGGVIRDLLPADYSVGRALDINESGQVVGWTVTPGGASMVAFIWTPATGLTVLPSLPGETNTAAYAINDAGMVVGYSGRAAVAWVNGAISVLRLDQVSWSTATDVNSAGEVVGYHEPQFSGGPTETFFWSSATGAQPLPTLNGAFGYVTSINDRGQIVGWSAPPGETTYGFIRENGVTRRLSSAAFGPISAHAISESGQVVGQDGMGRVILSLADGTAIVLCTPVVAATGYTASCFAGDINSSGVSVGHKTDKYGNTTKAYRWSLTAQ